ncbi:hypothetical protein B0T22DRAFT_466792 [Podospora appendiculata]|uniref:Secreted protein n=1 Tax=Podospora appendiculata TaxID=314037 RepID=A0AAE0X6U5_9PEZI|nr:hypothetical protein B0T22DRAFT_466792 [Podospora appendiculata]
MRAGLVSSSALISLISLSMIDCRCLGRVVLGTQERHIPLPSQPPLGPDGDNEAGVRACGEYDHVLLVSRRCFPGPPRLVEIASCVLQDFLQLVQLAASLGEALVSFSVGQSHD